VMAGVVIKHEKGAHLPKKKLTCSGPCVQLSVKTISLVLVYYALSIGLTFYQHGFLQVSMLCS
jgi:hypothetical protein